MIKQQAVTREMNFVMTYASFNPIDEDDKKRLLIEFDQWMRQTGKSLNFLVWKVSIKGNVND